jgi:acetyl-CoA synthetase
MNNPQVDWKTTAMLFAENEHHFNMATAAIDEVEQHYLDSDALVIVGPQGKETRYSFRQVRGWASSVADALIRDGLRPGDLIAVHLKPSIEAAVAHIGILKAGMVSVLLLSGDKPDALYSKIARTSPKAIFTNSDLMSDMDFQDEQSLRRCYRLVVADAELRLDGEMLSGLKTWLSSSNTVRSDLAIIAFTSGTESAPKAVMQNHEYLLGTLPSLEVVFNYPQPGELVYAPFDWGWLSGLGMLLGAWWFRMPFLIVESNTPDPTALLDALIKCNAKHVALMPTTLRLLRHTASSPPRHCFRSLTTGGERISQELHNWANQAFGFGINVLYGMTECPGIIGSGGNLSAPVGSMGRPIPGQNVCLIKEDGNEAAPGELGVIAVDSKHPGVFQGYLGDDLATRGKLAGSWLITGDYAVEDADGFFWYRSRSDGLIINAGTRISTERVEEVAIRNPLVQDCHALGVPDAITGEKVILFAVWEQDESETANIGNLYRYLSESLSSYEMPRRIILLSELPRTVTGKVAVGDLRRMVT